MNHEDLERAYYKFYPALLSHACAFVDDRSVGEDIVSNSILHLLNTRPSISSPNDLYSFLKAEIRNGAIRFMRNKREGVLTEKHNKVAIIQDLPLVEAELKHNIIKSLNKLTPRKKKAMELMIAGYKINDIAKEMSSTSKHIVVLLLQAQKLIEKDLLTNNKNLEIDLYKQQESRQQIIKIKEEVNDEFISYYTKHPHKLSHISPRQYEIFVAELLNDMGYQVWLNNPTRDGGRDIIAVLKTPSNDSFVTIVECKKYSPENPVPIEIVERFMYTIREKDKANAGWIVTTSTFSREAQKCQHNYKWLLSLKDNKDLATLCSNYGKWKRTSEGGLWLPDNPLG